MQEIFFEKNCFAPPSMARDEAMTHGYWTFMDEQPPHLHGDDATTDDNDDPHPHNSLKIERPRAQYLSLILLFSI
jgi:hypothetical protein